MRLNFILIAVFIVISSLRRFATTKHVHISLVIHPRKEDENSRLTLASVFGGGKAVQEADNVIVLQNDSKEENVRHVEVLKNRFLLAVPFFSNFFNHRDHRFDGDRGRVPVLFDKNSMQFLEMNSPHSHHTPYYNRNCSTETTYSYPTTSRTHSISHDFIASDPHSLDSLEVVEEGKGKKIQNDPTEVVGFNESKNLKESVIMDLKEVYKPNEKSSSIPDHLEEDYSCFHPEK